jgi:hypothetical protein
MIKIKFLARKILYLNLILQVQRELRKKSSNEIWIST